MKKILAAAALLVLVAAGCNRTSALMHDQAIQFKTVKLNVQLADTPEKRQAGLSGYTAIADDEGMLFLFSQPQQPVFWMKDMHFPLDIIWINGNRIVGIADNVKVQTGVSESNLTKYSPPSDVDKVLEVNAGWAFRHDINVGDSYKVLTP